jgi:hypothetical protein
VIGIAFRSARVIMFCICYVLYQKNVGTAKVILNKNKPLRDGLSCLTAVFPVEFGSSVMLQSPLNFYAQMC